uniref:Uncharacterized protein n=1 Tax=Noctiluca scintillans TaxID=2966 RepID=A0A7S1AGP5_NOCSC
MGTAMMHYHDAMKCVEVPFPFPYTACTDILLIIHWAVTPLVLCSWTSGPLWAALFTFIMVFVLWSLHFIAGELENPFGCDVNDLHMTEMQREINMNLIRLVKDGNRQTPRLCVDHRIAALRLSDELLVGKSFKELFQKTVLSSAELKRVQETLPITTRPLDFDIQSPEVSVTLTAHDDVDGCLNVTSPSEETPPIAEPPSKTRTPHGSCHSEGSHLSGESIFRSEGSLEISALRSVNMDLPRLSRHCSVLRGPNMVMGGSWIHGDHDE